MRRVIIESPIAGATPELAARNLRYLRACMRWCLLKGWSPYASHGLYTQDGVLRDDVPEERKLGIGAGFAWRSGAEATCVFHDLGFSSGMNAGIEHAKSVVPDSIWRWGHAQHPIEYYLLGGEWDLGLSQQGRLHE